MRLRIRKSVKNTRGERRVEWWEGCKEDLHGAGTKETSKRGNSP
jgi:hypothetical protein